VTAALRVLLVEDSEDDAKLVEREFQLAGYEFRPERVDSAAALKAALAREPWDVIISDHSMPHLDAPTALEIVRQRDRDTPFVIVSGAIGEPAAVRLMKAGANDFVPKQDLTRLVAAVEREIREAKERREHSRTSALVARLGRIVDGSPDEVYVFDTERFRIVEANRGACARLGRSREQLLSGTFVELFEHPTPEAFAMIAAPLRTDAEEQIVYEALHRRADGTTFPVEVRLQLFLAERPPVFVAFVQDVSERRRLEHELASLLARERAAHEKTAAELRGQGAGEGEHST